MDQFVKLLLNKRRAPLYLTVLCQEVSVTTKVGLAACRGGLRYVCFSDDVLEIFSDEAHTAFDGALVLHHAAWCAAALTAFVRAHGGHPFARSVVSLIPSVIALGGREVDGARGFERKASALIETVFAQSHLGVSHRTSTPPAAAAAAAAAGAAPPSDGDADGDATMTVAAERSGRKRRR
jgi:hypothetical protein